MTHPVCLVGPRVILRLGTVRDATLVAGYFRRNRRHLRRWEPVRSAAFYTVEHWRKQLRRNAHEFRKGQSLKLLLCHKDVLVTPIGTVNLTNVVRGVFQSCTLGYSIDAREQGRGLMREALELAVAYAFEQWNLHRIMANYMPGNRRSAGLLRRLGFRIEGRAKQYLQIAGRWEDHVLTSRVNPRWRKTGP